MQLNKHNQLYHGDSLLKSILIRKVVVLVLVFAFSADFVKVYLRGENLFSTLARVMD